MTPLETQKTLETPKDPKGPLSRRVSWGRAAATTAAAKGPQPFSLRGSFELGSFGIGGLKTPRKGQRTPKDPSPTNPVGNYIWRAS